MRSPESFIAFLFPLGVHAGGDSPDRKSLLCEQVLRDGIERTPKSRVSVIPDDNNIVSKAWHCVRAQLLPKMNSFVDFLKCRTFGSPTSRATKTQNTQVYVFVTGPP